MTRRRPLKPAKEIAVAVFPKAGGVRRVTRPWPRTLVEQELAATTTFAEALMDRAGRRIERVTALPERDHDLEASEAGRRVVIEVTELVTHPFRLEEVGRGIYRVDMDRLRDALRARVEAKVDRGYDRPAGTTSVLLVYCVDEGRSSS